MPHLPGFILLGEISDALLVVSGRGGVSRVRGSARAPRLPGLIVLGGGFSGALLVGPILDIVYDCHVSRLLQS